MPQSAKMSVNPPKQKFDLFLALRKFLVSAFVIIAFALYVLIDRQFNPEDAGNVIIPTEVAFDPSATPQAFVSTPTPVTPVPTSTIPPTNTHIPTTAAPILATATPIPPTATSKAVDTGVRQSIIPSSTPIPPTATFTASATSTPIPPTATYTNIPPTKTPIPPTATKSGQYKDGQFTGIIADAFYGNVQVKVTVSGGKITTVQFLDYPHDRRTSQMINAQAMPYLKTETIQAQNANVNIISGATLTSEAFIQSLQSALSKAKA